MSDEELNSIIENAEMHLEQLKDHNHDLYEENKELKQVIKEAKRFIEKNKHNLTCRLNENDLTNNYNGELLDLLKILERVKK